MAIGFSAGVYVKETDLSQIVQPTSTSIGAIVGASKRGPINTPVLITSDQAFIEEFGAPDPSISYMHYSALAFLQQSSQLYVVRVAGTGYSYGGILMQKLTTGSANILTTYTVTDPLSVDFATAGGVSVHTENLAYIYAKGPGSYSSTLKVGIRSKNLATPAAPTVTTSTTGGTLGSALATSYKITAINSIGETLPSAAGTVTTGAGTTNSNTITWTAVPGAISYKIYGRTAGTELYIASTTSLTYTDTGAITPSGAIPVVAATTDEFTLDVYDTAKSATNAVESFDVTLRNKLDGFNQQMELEYKVNTFSKLIKIKSNVPNITGTLPNIYAVAATSLASGNSGSAVTDSNITNGWQQFKDPEAITVRLLINGGYASATVHLAMDTLAQSRGDCVAILDMPVASQTVAEALNYRNTTLNLNSNRSALYTPDLKINDSYNDLVLYVPPSGHVAAVYAKTDFVAQPWFAPAGLNRGVLNVLGLRYKYNFGDREFLAPAQISYMRNFPGQGIAVWEQKTMQAKTSALSFMNVRRLLDVIEISVSKALLYSNFEPNDDLLRMQIVGMIGEFLEAIKNGRGIQQFLVVSDASNNSPSSVGQGILQIDCYITPVLPSERILLQTVITKQGASFQELVARGGQF